MKRRRLDVPALHSNFVTQLLSKYSVHFSFSRHIGSASYRHICSVPFLQQPLAIQIHRGAEFRIQCVQKQKNWTVFFFFWPVNVASLSESLWWTASSLCNQVAHFVLKYIHKKKNGENIHRAAENVTVQWFDRTGEELTSFADRITRKRHRIKLNFTIPYDSVMIVA